MYISTHKDFKNNVITNPAYKILCDSKSQLKNNYNLEIIETNINNKYDEIERILKFFSKNLLYS